MIEAQFQLLAGQWQVLKAAAGKWHDDEDGVTTIEILIIAAVLLFIAGAMATIFTNIWTNDKASITG